MKKKIIISLGIVVLIAIIVIIVVLNTNKPTKSKLENYKNYYKATYSASYNNPVIILNDKKDYELVNNKSRLYEILNKTNNQDLNNIFDSKFFENNQALVIQGGISSEINTLDVSDTNVNIVIYYASPLTDADKILNYDLYIVPINKSIGVNNVKITETTYPDRLY